jgi:hypothetical protein
VTQNGFTLTWQSTHQPSYDYKLTKIAACPVADASSPHTLWGLTTNPANGAHPLYKSTNGGKTWTLQTTVAAAYTSIGCKDPSAVYLFNDSADKLDAFTPGGPIANVLSGLGTIAKIQSGYELLVGVTTGGGTVSLRMNPLTGAKSFISQAASASGSVTSATTTVGVNATHRAFQLSSSQLLYYRVGGLNSTSSWIQLARAWVNEGWADVSAAHPTVIYVMTTANSLWRGIFTESACGDGLDNDGDLLKDGDDPDCP